MKTLREYINEAKEKGIAVGHFNISNLEAFNAIYEGAKEIFIFKEKIKKVVFKKTGLKIEEEVVMV